MTNSKKAAVLSAQEMARNLNKALQRDAEWYDVRRVLGNTWAMFFFIIGAREAGKSYSVMDFCLRQWKNKGIPFVWIRLSPLSVKKMLQNKASKFVDADLMRKYDIELSVKGMDVFDHGKPMAKVLALADMAKEKGVALFDKDYDGYYHIVCDEFQREPGEVKRFDTRYNLANTLENLVRSRKDKIRIFLICNMLEEANEILASFNFIPEAFGTYKLKRKRAVVDYVAPSASYSKRREGAVANIMMGDSSNYTNKIRSDNALIYKGAVRVPLYVIKFQKDESTWYTMWSANSKKSLGSVIRPYKGEKKPAIAMSPYIDEVFNTETRNNIYKLFDGRQLLFCNLMTEKKFQNALELIKARR